MKLDGFSVILVGVIVTLLSVVIMLSLFVHVSSTELGSIAEVIMIEQMKSCISPTTLCRKPFGCKEILGTGTTSQIENDCTFQNVLLMYVLYVIYILICTHVRQVFNSIMLMFCGRNFYGCMHLLLFTGKVL